MRKLYLVFLIVITIGCSKTVSLIKEGDVEEFEIYIAKAIPGELFNYNEGKYDWVELKHEDNQVVNNKLHELKSGVNYSSCLHILYIKAEGKLETNYFIVDACGYVWPEDGIYKGVDPSFWKTLKVKYIK